MREDKDKLTKSFGILLEMKNTFGREVKKLKKENLFLRTDLKADDDARQEQQFIKSEPMLSDSYDESDYSDISDDNTTRRQMMKQEIKEEACIFE
jgi:hypothetical protein